MHLIYNCLISILILIGPLNHIYNCLISVLIFIGPLITSYEKGSTRVDRVRVRVRDRVRVRVRDRVRVRVRYDLPSDVQDRIHGLEVAVLLVTFASCSINLVEGIRSCRLLKSGARAPLVDATGCLRLA
jgi:hypothetical protein